MILLTIGGVPSIYAGDEFGFHGVKEERRGGDDAVPAAPAPGKLSPEVSKEMMAAMGRAVQNLAGAYITAEDSGTGDADILVSLNHEPTEDELEQLRDHVYEFKSRNQVAAEQRKLKNRSVG